MLTQQHYLNIELILNQIMLTPQHYLNDAHSTGCIAFHSLFQRIMFMFNLQSCKKKHLICLAYNLCCVLTLPPLEDSSPANLSSSSCNFVCPHIWDFINNFNFIIFCFTFKIKDYYKYNCYI